MSKPVAVLSCRAILQTGPGQRADAFEHDVEMSHFGPAFAAIGRPLQPVCWDDVGIDWSAYESAIIRTTWDYQDRLEQFMTTLDRIDRQTRVLNPPSTARWNVDKGYLFTLQGHGVPILPTRRLDSIDLRSLQDCLVAFGTDQLVIKRCIGASAEGQHLYRDGEAVPSMDSSAGPWLVQPFQHSIRTEGELSLVLFGDRFSHAIRKRPAAGDYRVQSLYGGLEEAEIVHDDSADIAARALSVVSQDLLYARVDLMRTDAGSLAVTELELIEPYLYPSHGTGVGAALARRYLEIMG